MERVSESFVLEAISPGILESLRIRPTQRRPPGTAEVEIQISAAGLNFKDLLFALGLIPLPPTVRMRLGSECAGRIVRVGEGVDDFDVGDEVVAFGYGCFSPFTTPPVHLVAHKPARLSFEEAATLPVALTTAFVALLRLARLRRGERVLIHAAAGGVGIAAVQIAQRAGAEIFATAGSEEKRQFLRSLGVEQVMDSRSLGFADEVMKRTAGRGVHVVLNSLSGEFIRRSLSVLAPQGRFVEIGKRDIYADTQLGLRLFERGVSFFALNLDWTQPGFSRLWRRIVRLVGRGELRPLPYRVFPVADAVEAFRYMAEARHIGKIVLSVGGRDEVEPGNGGEALARAGHGSR